MGVYNRKVGWDIRRLLFEVCDGNVITWCLEDLKSLNILKIELKKHMLEDGRIVIKKLFILWIYWINKVKKSI